MKYPFILNKQYHESAKQFLSSSEIRNIGNLPGNQDIFWKVQGVDELLGEADSVDLGRFGIEQLYSVPAEKYQFIINERLFVSHEPFVTEQELRHVGQIPPDDHLFFKEEGGNRQLKPGDKIDLRPYPVEEFYSVKVQKLVIIKINNNPFEVKPGKYSVAEIRKIGSVNPAHALGELINNDLIELSTDAEVIIKGGEEFKSYARGGTSS